jgi:hypothetical protein
MESHLVAKGERRLRSSPEFKARLREVRQSVKAWHAAELETAGLLRRMVLQWQIYAEYRQERRIIVPSRYSLYVAKGGRSV